MKNKIISVLVLATLLAGVLVAITLVISFHYKPTPQIINSNNETRENQQEITNYIQCAALGNPIEEGLPRKCTANGNTFEESKNMRKDCSETCPEFIPPPQGWCEDGKILPPLINKCGCSGALRCVPK